MPHLAIFFVSFFCILLELFFTRILNLKAWNHLVYIIISFAILGYGIGANIQFLLQKRVEKYDQNHFLGGLLIGLSILAVASSLIMIKIPIMISYLESLFQSVQSLGMLLLSYMVIMVPFVLIGFIIVYLFSSYPKEMYKLYFLDLVGAGLGAATFFLMIEVFEVFRSIVILSVICFFIGAYGFFKKLKNVLGVLCILSILGVAVFFYEPTDYVIDSGKGWEYVPGFFKKDYYKTLLQKWHPLGRTDIYEILDPEVREFLYQNINVTFQVNVKPIPEFAYFSTNFLAGTPVYRFSALKEPGNKYQVKLFSEDIELPYILLDKPRVFVIGAGGGRDIFMARTHGAPQVVAAEINPATYQTMKSGGAMYDYSGKVYGAEEDNVSVFNIDGRHLVKRYSPGSFDLIILNGVDTFSGLSSGAYAYAESYLYTKNAIKDYLRILDDNGVINFNRWLYTDMPRETLRLQAIALEALKETGASKPWEHIAIIETHGWSIFLIKRTPFTESNRNAIAGYVTNHGTCRMIYPSGWVQKIENDPLMVFDIYANLYQINQHKAFEHFYPFDISVITDDAPFFYKYYRLKNFNPFHIQRHHQTGTIIFLTQFLILIQAIVFIVIFIFLPLFLSKRIQLQLLPRPAIWPCVIYFSCLGIGFMLIEIPIMQRFVLLLGSPIYSLSVVLAVLLIATGTGSGLLPGFKKKFETYERIVTIATFIVIAYIILLVVVGTNIYDGLLQYSLAGRVCSVALILSPLGVALGIFFPSGLHMIERKYRDVIPWAWGLNCGFSVLGSVLSIIVAQFWGFNFVLMFAVVFYLIGLLAFLRMSRGLA